MRLVRHSTSAIPKEVFIPLLLFFAAGNVSVRAEATLQPMFCGGVVLQRNIEVQVWGWAKVGD